MAKKALKYIPVEKFKPIADELVLRCGSQKQAALYANVSEQVILRLRKQHAHFIQKTTAQKLVLALQNKRLEDRASHSTSKEMKARAKEIARLEREFN